MSEGGIAAGPTGQRIETLDFVRGCALFGILLMNITAMGLAEAYTNPANSGGAAGADLWAWMATEIGFEGTQRALFSMLFGAGVLLFVSRAEDAGRPDAVDLFLRRTLWLILFGMLNAWVLIWYGDILYGYGVAGLFVVAFRKLSVKALLVVGLVGLLFNVGLNLNDAARITATQAKAAPAMTLQRANRPISADQEKAVEAWEEASSEFVAPAGKVGAETKAMRGGYASAWAEIAGKNSFVQSWYMYRFFFDLFAMMMIGMALLKAGVLTLEAPAKLYWAMLVAGYGIGLATNIAETRWIVDHQFSALSFAQARVSYDLGRLAMTAGHLGLMLLFCRSGLFGWLRRSMAAVGRMALTNYLSHSLMALVLFVILRQFGEFARHQLYYIVFAVWTAQLILSPYWLRHFYFGPVEWLWRALTYMKAPPFRKRALPPAELAPAAA